MFDDHGPTVLTRSIILNSVTVVRLSTVMPSHRHNLVHVRVHDFQHRLVAVFFHLARTIAML